MNMNTRVYLLFVFILGLLTGCDERELTEVSDDIAYLSFTTDISRDSTILSFVAYPTGVIEQDIVIEIRGCLLTEPRTFSLSVDEEKSTFPAQYCIFPEKSASSLMRNLPVRESSTFILSSPLFC